MKVKYQITMEVEVEVDSNSEILNRQTANDISDRIQYGRSKFSYTVNKVEVSRIGATGVTPVVKRTEQKKADTEHFKKEQARRTLREL